MRIATALRKIMKQTGWTQVRMAEAVGAKTQSVISRRLEQKNISFDIAQKMLDVMGYEIVVQPVSSGKRRDGAIVINGVDDE